VSTDIGELYILDREDRRALERFNRKQFEKMGLLKEEEMEKKIKPTRNLLLCRAKSRDGRVSDGGIFIPDTVAGRENEAEVLAVGEGWYTSEGVLVPCCVKPGDVILFDPYRVVWAEGVSMEVQTKHAQAGKLFLIHDDSALAVMEV